ncbi:hypothetical protein LguiA_016040 [Lonicera macranthoides]
MDSYSRSGLMASHGVGVQTCSDGSCYIGQFKFGVKHGLGCYQFRMELMMMIGASILIMGSLMNVAEAEAEEVIHVAGKVLCQDCTQGWNEWVTGAKPIKGCKVSITCMDDRSRVIYYGSDLTDEAGDFDMTINKHIYGKELNPKGCFLRLISSPDPVCNIATDFAGGRTGVKLGRPAVVYRDVIKHILGPFYYTTPMCDEPDTNTDEFDGESNGQGTNY